MFIIKKIAHKLLISISLILVLCPCFAYADESEDVSSESILNSTITNIADQVNTNINVDSNESNVGVDTGDESNINVDTGVHSQVYINGEGLNNLRPQYHVSKTTYNDNWIKSEIERINYNMEVLANGLDNIYAKQMNDVNELYKALVLLREELYKEMNLLYYGQTKVKTIIGSNSFTVNEDLHKFNAQTTFRKGPFTTLMSIRLLEKLGVKFYFERVNDVGVVTMVYGDTTVVLRENSNIMVVANSKEVKKITLTVPMLIFNSRTFIPTRDVSEHLGFEVLWDEVTDSIMISLPIKNKPVVLIDEAIYLEKNEKDTTADESNNNDIIEDGSN